MPPDSGARKYSFAVISDTHVNPDDDRCNSPFPVNARANRRFRHVVADLNTRDIAFVVHLGDLVHPVPGSGQLYSDAAASYKKIVADLKVSIHILPGNHDIGDTPIKGAPSEPTSSVSISVWEQHFGPQYSAFSHDGIRYILLNAQLINSGLPDEAAQRAWVEAELATMRERVFLMLHHPAYLCTPDEPGHYDNTDPPGRSWLLNLLQRHDVEAMFSGHAHNFWYDRFENTDYFLAPATSFVRQDYSEMGRTAPPEDSELGRDDRAKLGYFLITVYEHGHSVQIIRTYGAELTEEQSVIAFEPSGPTPCENTTPLIGFDLRQNWAELTEIPPSGGLDEFDRKTVRNDYHLLALIEMGIRDIRIPFSDLRDPARFKRLKHLRHLGFRPTLFGYGIPSDDDLALVIKAADTLEDWEMTIDWPDFEPLLADITAAHEKTGLPIFLSRMRNKADLSAGATYFHVINHGFGPGDGEMLERLSGTVLSGAVFRLGASAPVAGTLDAITGKADTLGLTASVHLRTAGDNPALIQDDQQTAIRRVREAMDCVAMHPNLRIFCDALVESDRGYFGRIGAIDRQGNPTTLLRAIKDRHRGN